MRRGGGEGGDGRGGEGRGKVDFRTSRVEFAAFLEK